MWMLQILRLTPDSSLCFDSCHELLLSFYIFFRVFLVRLLFYAVCPDKVVRGLRSKKPITHPKAGQTEESTRLFSFDEVNNDTRPGTLLPALRVWGTGARNDYRHEGRRWKERQG